jgi:hypothetical protein
MKRNMCNVYHKKRIKNQGMYTNQQCKFHMTLLKYKLVPMFENGNSS